MDRQRDGRDCVNECANGYVTCSSCGSDENDGEEMRNVSSSETYSANACDAARKEDG